MNLTSAPTPIPEVIQSAGAAPPNWQPVVLPWWGAAAILGGLVGFSTVMVLTALLIVALLPAPLMPDPETVAAQNETPAAAPVGAAPLPPQEAKIVQEELPAPELPREWIKLARKMPSATEDLPPILSPVPEVRPDPKVAAEAPAKIARPTLQIPIKWAVETPAPSKRDMTNLIVPIEIARVDQDDVRFTLRRLRFADDPKPLKLAVTPFSHDDVAALLKSMGDGYRYTTIRNEDTWSLVKLRNYDVVFLTCADMYPQDFQAALPLRKFVEAGGTLYASDLRGDLLLTAFPEFRSSMQLMPGVQQSVDATVTDKGLQAYLGRKTIPITFDAPNWRPAAFDARKTTVCLKGAYRNNLGETWMAPLLVKFRVGRGTVIFTSFHHSKNDSAIVQKLVEYLVFSSVSARSEARVRELMLRSQFAAEDLRPAFVSADRKAEGICKHAGGDLQIALAFENLGATLKLTLRSPSGKTIEHEDQGVFLVEIPQAEAGAWQYTVTPITLPHANFPILVAVGKAKS